jgi:hypothetical protein
VKSKRTTFEGWICTTPPIKIFEQNLTLNEKYFSYIRNLKPIIEMKQTVVELQVLSKTEGYQYQNKTNPKEWQIELGIDYNTQNVFYKLSGGTNMFLRTINPDAAAMFEIGETVVMTIAPKTPETT